MVDVRGDVLRPPHGTTPAAVKANKIQKLSSFKSNETIHKRLVHGLRPFLLKLVNQYTFYYLRDMFWHIYVLVYPKVILSYFL